LLCDSNVVVIPIYSPLGGWGYIKAIVLVYIVFMSVFLCFVMVSKRG